MQWRRYARDPWQDRVPIRSDLFGLERLEHHARSLASAQSVTTGRPVRVPPLAGRLKENASVLLDAYRSSALALQAGKTVTPAAEWLLDNYHLVEQQVRQIKDDLPPGYYRQLPKLADGPFAGYPRVLGLAWAYVAHTDSLVSRPSLVRFVDAYQEVQPLTIGEIWAVAITLRILLVENMRRLATEISDGQAMRRTADALVDRVIGTGKLPAENRNQAVAAFDALDLPEIMAAQMAKRLRGFDPAETPLRGWLEDKLSREGSSLDMTILNAQTRQAATNVSMRNVVTSMRLVSEMDWADFFEEVSLIDARLRESTGFANMDFVTRNRYRTAIEDLARGSGLSEIAVTEEAVALAAGNADELSRDPGFSLIGPARGALEQSVRYMPPLRLTALRWTTRLGLRGYLSSIAICSVAVLGAAIWVTGAAGAGAFARAVLALTGLVVASEAGSALVNLIVTRSVGPTPLPGLDLLDGVPEHLRTIVAVPVILTGVPDLEQQLERLEVHHLSSADGALHYALLSDGPDSPSETTDHDDALIAAAVAGIARLNATYPSENGDRFLLLHRRRKWNASEGCWMGWERKRGKLTELNRVLRGETDTSFLSLGGPAPLVPAGVRYVITLDADTRLLRDTVRRMIGKMAHPLNRPIFDPVKQRVTRGYGILQPRVTPALPVAQEGSVFQRVFSSPGGIEPYAAAISDVYQDLFEEGSFTGKGIYDIDVFEAALSGRVPENAMLSHDLFEGIFARAALASDIEVVEDFPARFDVASRRQHRWTRGDWQLFPWIFGTNRTDRGGIPAIGWWKMVDNLRRSLVAPMTLATLFAGWLMPLPVAAVWTGCILAVLALPKLWALPLGILPGRAGITARSHLVALASDTATAAIQIALTVVFLADTAWQMLDAIARSLVRLALTRRNLLEWMTAAQGASSTLPDIAGYYRSMAGGVALGLSACALAMAVNPAIWPVVVPLALLWLAAPAIAQIVSRPRAARTVAPLSEAEAHRLRLIGRRTWRYFETFVSEADNFLPPDNFQEVPKPAIAHRTSPTNIGLYLLSTVAAHDMGWIGLGDALDRLERTLATMQRMPRFRGHLYNWYDTRDLRVLDPPYISSVDSGNLAGHLICVSRALRDWRTASPDRARGLLDTLQLAEEAVEDAGLFDTRLRATLTLLADALADQNALGDPELARHAARATDLAKAIADPDSELVFWTTAVETCLAGHQVATASNDELGRRLDQLAQLAHRLAAKMEFGFLLEPEKKLLSIGFSVGTNTLDPSCYDLMASEARLASFFAIAKGDVETRHWFRLGRAATPIGAGSALISWSGSMFEYLMPSLVMRAPVGSVLEQTNRLIVARQQAHSNSTETPWGISESAYNARDLEMSYQYSNFGVPGLGLKRGLGENRVVAPYATALAAMVDPAAAVRNFARLAALGAEGCFGFFEALDYTPARLPAEASFAIVRSFMAHHQGMTITAIANVLLHGCLRDRFHAEPMIQGVDLLLQERVPRDVATTHPRAEEVLVGPVETSDIPIVRRFDDPAAAAPTAHLLSNGTYGVMMTPTGAGFSNWRDLAVTRWHADPTRSDLGSFIFAQDTASGELWSAGVQPKRDDAERHMAVFCEHHAAFTHRGGRLTTTTEIVVSAEDDAEARRVTLTNSGRTAREVDLTSYAELVLAPPAADLAHPAFSKMFVVTDFMPELGVIIATRRRRSPQDPEVWAAHIAVVEGIETAPIQVETDRARFIGRGRSIDTAQMLNAPLSGTVGTVLDPVFSIRRRVSVPAGGMARVTFWTMVSASSDLLLDQVERHSDPSSFDRALTLSWTRAEVQLRHLGVTHAEASDFQRLSGALIRSEARLRASAAQISAGAGPQSGLWQLGISGDLPIVLLLIEDAEDIAHVNEVLSAHEYWRMRRYPVDLVILNERSSSYIQDLQIAIETAVRSAQTIPRTEGRHGTLKGAIHTLRADLVAPEARALLIAVASAVLVAGRGSIGQQLDGMALSSSDLARRPQAPRMPVTVAKDVPLELEFFNGIGGFADNGREYVTVLRDGQTTPAPWINVIANPGFGFLVSAEGTGHVWAENSRENQITPWSNDPVCDPSGEAIYIRDLDSDQVWTTTAQPVRTEGTYVARHGFGYSSFQHGYDGLECEMVQFVPLDEPVKITRLTIHNTSNRTRRVVATAYVEWALGPSRQRTASFVTTAIDPPTGAILARNPWSIAFPGRVAFADFGVGTTSCTADRTEVLGRDGSMADPAGLRKAELSGASGPALDPCAALQRYITLAPGERTEVVFLLGQAASTDDARALILRTRATDPGDVLAGVKRHWHGFLTTVQVRSPDRAMDIMLNGWLLYQTLACRIWARAGFYQASGAYGFRDQLQDGMALAFSRPELTREHLLRAASRQFPEGDVQHWWLPHSGQGVRTRISDDRVWLGYCAAHYVQVSGDAGVLDEVLPFLEGPAVDPGAHDSFFLPVRSERTATLFEHCALGLDMAVVQTGANGMPLIGTGDWNDGMNRVGEGGAGTSVWLGWLLIAAIDQMAPLADRRDPARAARWRAHASAVREAIEREGWDGEWYRRGTYDDGTILGTAASDECRIDGIAQSWAVLSGAADPTRAATAMASMTKHLVRADSGLALLFTPPFDRTPLDPGYIKGYPPGLRENGGQYSHAAMWAILAQARLGNGDAAGELFALLNPINHAMTLSAAARYKVEPYVIAADVYSAAPHEGRGGWTWYTGSAGWMYRAGIEGLLGLTRSGQTLTIDPCFPKVWPRLEATVSLGASRVEIIIENPQRTGRGIVSAELDGIAIVSVGGPVNISLCDHAHRLNIRLGPAASS